MDKDNVIVVNSESEKENVEKLWQGGVELNAGLILINRERNSFFELKSASGFDTFIFPDFLKQ